MGLSTNAPYPFDIILGGVSFMLTRDRGTIAFTEEWPSDTHAQPAGEQRIEWRDWIGGAGAMRDWGDDPSVRKTLMYTDSATDLAGLDASFGTLMLAPEVVPQTINAGDHPLVLLDEPWTDSTGTTRYWAAAGTGLYASVTGQWGDAALVYTAGSRITDLVAFAGTNGATHLYVAQADGPIVASSNGSTFANLHNPNLIQVHFDAVYVTKNSGTDWTDATAVLSDADTATNADLDALPATAVGQILFGFFQPFTGVSIHIPASANTNASVMSVEYWSGGAWVATTALDDDTDNAGKSFGFVDSSTSDHHFGWGFPTDWDKAILVDTLQSVPLYFVRVTFSNAFSGTVRVSEAYVGYDQTAQVFGVVGPYLWIGFATNRVAWTQDGGLAPVWHFTTQPVGEEVGEWIALLAANGAIYARRTHDFSSPRADGTVVQYLDGALSPPVGTTDQAATSWNDHVFFSHAETLWDFAPLDQSAESSGPERLALVHARPLQGRLTCAVGDRGHALYAVLWNATEGRSWLWKQGGYLFATDQDGVPRWQRRDGWFCLNNLGEERFVSAAAYTDASGEPRLVLGTAEGAVAVIKLAASISPLDDPEYRYTTGVGEAYFPTVFPPEPSREITPLAFSVIARDTATNQWVRVDSRDPADTDWTEQGAWTGTNGRQVANDPTGSLGLDVRVRLSTANAEVSPRVVLVGLGYAQPLDTTGGSFEATILCADDVSDLMGRRVGGTASGWVNAVMGLGTGPLGLVKPDGTNSTVRIVARRVVWVASERAAGRTRAVRLGLSEIG